MSREGSLSRTRRLFCLFTALIWGIALGCSSAAHAASIVQIGGSAGSGLHGLGAFSGSISYSAASALSTTSTLVISLANFSNPTGGGVSLSAATLVSASNSFINCVGGGLNDGLNDREGHAFAAGSAIGGWFLGSGDPNPGIALGQSAALAFRVSADDAGRLRAIDFLAGGSFDFNFLVRFTGFDDGGPDNVGAVVVPLPPAVSIGLLGLALAAAAAFFKNRSERAKKTAEADTSSKSSEQKHDQSAFAAPPAASRG